MIRLEAWGYSGNFGPLEVSFLGVRCGEFHLEELVRLAEFLLPYLLETQAEVVA